MGRELDFEIFEGVGEEDDGEDGLAKRRPR
jgi:hypothetical protein